MSSPNPTPDITLFILESYYPSVIDMRTYLNCLFQSSILDHVQISSPDSPSYTCLLNTTYVASSQPPNKSFAYFPPNFDMREVGKVFAHISILINDDTQIIDQAQTRLFRSKNTQNVLTLGYRLVRNLSQVLQAGLSPSVGISYWRPRKKRNGAHWDNQYLCQHYGYSSFGSRMGRTFILVSH
jgi:hypothetical protein